MVENVVLEIIKSIGGAAGSITAIIACLAVVFKPLRKRVLRVFGSNKAQLAMLRNEITQIYYGYLSSKKLPTYIRENLILLNEAYVELGGNTYVNTIVHDMLAWEVSNI